MIKRKDKKDTVTPSFNFYVRNIILYTVSDAVMFQSEIVVCCRAHIVKILIRKTLK